ncbi:MAG: hypothetical protein Q7N95_00830, partial [Alphaproteobacteria bacterium]|nr:hypothetical protein [Alphaproteobacteria bacterium]
MNQPSIINESAEDRREQLRIAAQLINGAINPLWNLGRYSVVGWRACDGGIDIATIATAQLMKLCKTSDEYTNGARQMGDRRYREVCDIPGVQSTLITLPDQI